MALAPAFIINSRSQDDHICLFQQILENKNFKQYNKNTQRGTFRLIGKLEHIYLPVQGEPGSARRLLDLNAEFWINGSSLSRAPRCVSVIDLSAFPCRRIHLSIKPSTCSHPAAAAGRRLSVCPSVCVSDSDLIRKQEVVLQLVLFSRTQMNVRNFTHSRFYLNPGGNDFNQEIFQPFKQKFL